jgi:hypothetical protein
MRLNAKMNHILKKMLVALLAMFSLALILICPGLPWSDRCNYMLRRFTVKTQFKLATWRGQRPKFISLFGRLKGDGGLQNAASGARIIALESATEYAAMSNGNGEFLLPHIPWYPDAAYHLIVVADQYHASQLIVKPPLNYPKDDFINIGELKLDDNSAIELKESSLRSLFYDGENARYYSELFNRLTANLNSDHQKISAICNFIASRHNPKENAWGFKSARQIIERGAPHCSNLAFAMAALTTAGGFPSRTVHTSDTPQYDNTHVVVEVFYDDSWHLYDPTYGISFLNHQGRVASYKELRLDPDLITRQAFGNLDQGKVTNALVWMAGTYRSGINQIYQVSEQPFMMNNND